ncbi:hypothetical protein M427DRAFT_57512 [Gonapodya prolifera JEL478]|uniref:Divalent ion tolerance protein n=1 Tax=Gonapodya prolifera (strain JEL478) TaxID=1344416 RepID=A0A139ACX9_GONPJ|nr:hypothetical protein M427DRAFT_57512 [Gonapodya prolifera JEL478]|eukprot:KXS14608.1 hypothetical protein M427DRAFT_57512 [Gonapodya prolifera JEL478]
MTSSVSAQEGSHPVILYVTVPDIKVAKSLSTSLLDRHLIACSNIIPSVTSIYRWEGKVTEDSELLMILKSQSHLVDEIANHVRENHPYEVPEVISTRIENGNPAYIKWILDNTAQSERVV